MSFSFSSLVRLIVMIGLGTFMLAIGLSRLDPPGPSWRSRDLTRYFHVNEYFMNLADRTPRWLDAETARVSSISLSNGDVLDAASSSPWLDEKGRRQVVGRWSSRTTEGPMSVSTDFGLARYSFPDGQLIDHVSTEIVPVGPPCWFPGLRARVLFAGGDGQLYHYAFEGDSLAKGPDQATKHDRKPIALEWHCPTPGSGRVFLGDLTWPEDPRMAGHVVVALREQSHDPKSRGTLTGTALWWLKLNFAGTAIVECGRLLDPADEKGVDSKNDRRCPTVGTLKDGRPVVAYLSENPVEHGWELRVVTIEFEGDRHIPRADESRSLVLDNHCQPAHPSFSADGRWLNAISESSGTGRRILRLPLAQLFPASN